MNTHTVVDGGEIPPRRFLHLTFPVAMESPLHVDVSVVDRHDLQAEACLDKEGWYVIIITNVVDVPVSITPLEPLTLVITPARGDRRRVVAKRTEDRPARTQK